MTRGGRLLTEGHDMTCDQYTYDSTDGILVCTNDADHNGDHFDNEKTRRF